VNCAQHNFSYTRGWMQMVFYYQMIYSPETNNTIKHDVCYGCWCGNWCTTHNDTYSVHKRGLMLWQARLLSSEAFWDVYPPPLSDTNCPPFPPPGGRGPPTPPASKMASISPGSTHTPSTPSVTWTYLWLDHNSVFQHTSPPTPFPTTCCLTLGSGRVHL
jgi:hypothetical protein